MQRTDSSSFTEQHFDYSGGRTDAPTLIVMVGPAGSGKSTVAKSLVNWGQGKTVRLNRDELRKTLFVDSPWNHKNEDLVLKYEEEGIRVALGLRLNVVVDDTNCIARTRKNLEQIAKASRAKFCLIVMNMSEKECKTRNALRTGKECIPEAAIEGQFNNLRAEPVTPYEYGVREYNRAVADREALQAGELRLRLPDAGIIICDIDGTVADCEGVRDAHDESQVLLDNCRQPVAAWLRALYPEKNIFMYSGRHDDCSEDTCVWLDAHHVPFDYLLMRESGSSVGDEIVKQRLLELLLKLVPIERITFILDDRPKIIEGVWRANGIKVYPVGGTTAHTASCTFVPEKKGWKNCPVCWALEDF